MDDLVEQSLGTMTDSLRSVVLVVAIIATGLTALIAVLVVTLLTTTRRPQNATLSALGWRTRRIRAGYLIQAVLAASSGALCGAVISVDVGGVLSLIVDFSFALNPWWFLLGAGIPPAAGLIATWLTTANDSTDIRSLT